MNGIENKVDCWSVGSRHTRDTLRTMDGNTMSFTNSSITLHTVNTMRAGNRLHVSKTTVRLFKAVMLVTKALMAMSFELIGAVAMTKVELNFFLAFRFGFRLRAGCSYFVSNCVVLVDLIAPLQKAWFYDISAATHPHNHQLIL